MTNPLGVDLYGLDDVDEGERLVDELQGLAQAIYRRLTTPRGSLLRAPNYGLDVRSFLGLEMTRPMMAQVGAQIRLEILKDERVQSCAVEVLSATRESLSLRIVGEASEGPFRLTLAASAITVELLNEGE